MTFDEFRKLVTNNLIERKTELKDLFNMVDHIKNLNNLDINKKQELEQYWINVNSNVISQIRFWIVALYSHFEWYIKLIADNYLELIYNNIDFLSLKDSLIRNKLDSIDCDNIQKYKNEVVSCLKDKDKYKRIVSESNLNYDIFNKNILKIFWFDIQIFFDNFKSLFLEEYRLWKNSDIYSLIKDKKTFSYIFDNYSDDLVQDTDISECKNIGILKFLLDFNLLKYRNSVAHWEMILDIDLTYEYLKDLEKLIYIFIDTYKEMILEDLIRYEQLLDNNKAKVTENVVVVPTWDTNEWNKKNKVYFCQKWRFFKDTVKYIGMYNKWVVNFIWKKNKVEWTKISNRVFEWDAEISDFIKQRYETLDFYDISEGSKELNFDWIQHGKNPVQFQQYILLEELLK